MEHAWQFLNTVQTSSRHSHEKVTAYRNRKQKNDYKLYSRRDDNGKLRFTDFVTCGSFIAGVAHTRTIRCTLSVVALCPAKQCHRLKCNFGPDWLLTTALRLDKCTACIVWSVQTWILTYAQCRMFGSCSDLLRTVRTDAPVRHAQLLGAIGWS